jgi:hypothetical protein
MIYVTQLIHVRDGRSDAFNEFDTTITTLVSRHNGMFLFRLRPDPLDLILSTIGMPYEIQLLRFETESDFHGFMHDEERKNLLHSKYHVIRSVILIKGQLVSPAARKSAIL